MLSFVTSKVQAGFSTAGQCWIPILRQATDSDRERIQIHSRRQARPWFERGSYDEKKKPLDVHHVLAVGMIVMKPCFYNQDIFDHR
jgi:hypothetical protein